MELILGSKWVYKALKERLFDGYLFLLRVVSLVRPRMNAIAFSWSGCVRIQSFS
jgi:hypothetical protein